MVNLVTLSFFLSYSFSYYFFKCPQFVFKFLQQQCKILWQDFLLRKKIFVTLKLFFFSIKICISPLHIWKNSIDMNIEIMKLWTVHNCGILCFSFLVILKFKINLDYNTKNFIALHYAKKKEIWTIIFIFILRFESADPV